MGWRLRARVYHISPAPSCMLRSNRAVAVYIYAVYTCPPSTGNRAFCCMCCCSKVAWVDNQVRSPPAAYLCHADQRLDFLLPEEGAECRAKYIPISQGNHPIQLHSITNSTSSMCVSTGGTELLGNMPVILL